MTDADDLLDHARRAFCQAAEASNVQAMQTFAEIGLTYLRMAHEDAAVFDASADTTPVLRLVK